MCTCVNDRSLTAVSSDVKVVLLTQDFNVEREFAGASELGFSGLDALLKAHKFTGKNGQSVKLSAVCGDKVCHLICVGVGTFTGNADKNMEMCRRAVGTAVKTARRLAVTSIAFVLPDLTGAGFSGDRCAEQLTIAAHLAAYVFDDFKDIKNKKEKWNPQFMFCGCCNPEAIKRGEIIVEAVNQMRHLADTPPNIAHPTFVSQEAEKVAAKHGLKCTVFGEERARELGMGGFLAVGAGSAQPIKFVTLEYNAPSATKTIALVGKGITFDTGGISLKPSNSMTGMKYDMSGAAAVMNAVQIISQLKPNVNVVALMPLTENMPGGSASRQDDIIVHMNGVTSEIENTDAEGRLILADALCYAEQFFKPDVIVDVATLTGACGYALGTFYAAIMSDDDRLAEQLHQVGNFVGDKVWRLPFDEDYNEAITHEFADIANSGKRVYLAGTITAGAYLRHFVKNARWAHIDIAGVADGVPGISYYGPGSTGASVRLLTEFVMRYASGDGQ